MKLAPIVFGTSVILSGIGLAIFVIPSVFNTFCASQLVWWAKKPKKKVACQADGQLFVIYKDTEDQILTQFMIPEIMHQTGMKTVTIYDSIYFGRRKTDLYRELTENSSKVLLLATEAMLSDRWLDFAMALCVQKDPDTLYLCYDEVINSNDLFQKMHNLIIFGCKILSLKAINRESLIDVHPSANDIAKFLANFKPTPWPQTDIDRFVQQQNLKYYAYVIYDRTDVKIPFRERPYLEPQFNPEIFCCADITLGMYEYQSYSKAILSSKFIFVIITQNLLRNPLFMFQLYLALRCKGHKSIVFILKNKIVHIPNSKIFRDAIATCQKICINS